MSSSPSSTRLDGSALPPGESPQRDAICDALTKALCYCGDLAYHAGERTTIDLRDEGHVRALARLLTTNDREDGWIGKETKELWQRIAAALATAAPALEGARDATGVLRTEEAPTLDDALLILNEAIADEERFCFSGYIDAREIMTKLAAALPALYAAALSGSVREDGSDADLANELLSDEATDHMLRELDASALQRDASGEIPDGNDRCAAIHPWFRVKCDFCDTHNTGIHHFSDGRGTVVEWPGEPVRATRPAGNEGKHQ